MGTRSCIEEGAGGRWARPRASSDGPGLYSPAQSIRPTTVGASALNRGVRHVGTPNSAKLVESREYSKEQPTP